MFPIPCSRCPALLTEREEVCPRCSTEGWCKWNAAWYRNVLTRVSIGQHGPARKAGKAFALTSVAFILASLATKSRVNPALQASDLLPAGLMLGFCTYEIWAYAHGCTTSIDRYSHKGKPANTNLRTCGLVLDVSLYAVIAFALWRM
jgi:hypothetical protein